MPIHSLSVFDSMTSTFDYDSLMELPGSPCGNDSGINSDDPGERSKSASSSYSSDDNSGSESPQNTEFFMSESRLSLQTGIEASDEEEELFAGLKLNAMDSGTIRSSKGTVRGVKNRVRAGIATFLQEGKIKSYAEKESGRVVVYLTTLGVIRETWARCFEVRKILRTLMVKAEEKDVFMSKNNQIELMERMKTSEIRLPQVFLEGQYLGDADVIMRMNETGKLRHTLRSYKSITLSDICTKCGDFGMYPCTSCNGSKKSLHRNNFTEKFVALRCTQCDDSALLKCDVCLS